MLRIAADRHETLARPMITAVLKGWDCVDHDPIEAWAPDAGPVFYWLVCHIGPDGADGQEMFTLPVVNHLGLHSSDWKQRARQAREVPPIVVEPYRWSVVLASVRDLVRQAEAHDWQGVVDGLRERFLWEYDDYR